MQDYLQNQIKHQLKCTIKYGTFSHCNNCFARGSKSAITELVEKRVCSPDADKTEWDFSVDERGVPEVETKPKINLDKMIGNATLDYKEKQQHVSRARSLIQPINRQLRGSSLISEASGSSVVAEPPTKKRAFGRHLNKQFYGARRFPQ